MHEHGITLKGCGQTNANITPRSVDVQNITILTICIVVQDTRKSKKKSRVKMWLNNKYLHYAKMQSKTKCAELGFSPRGK